MSTSENPPSEGEAPRADASGLGDVVARLRKIEKQLSAQRGDDDLRELALKEALAERDALRAQVADLRAEQAAFVNALVAARRTVQTSETRAMRATDTKFGKVVTAAEHMLAFVDEGEPHAAARGSALGFTTLRDVWRSIRILDRLHDPKRGAVRPLRLFLARVRNHGMRGAIERLERDVTNTLLHRERSGATVDWTATRFLALHHRRRLLQRLRDRAHELASLVRTTLRPALAMLTASLPNPGNVPTRAAPKRMHPLSGRVVVYTAVVSGYDELRDPPVVPPGWDFVAFSDRALHSDTWSVRPLNYVDREPTRSARFVKLHPHLYFPDHEFSIWVDANITPLDDLSSLITSLGERSFVGLFPHPHRDCVYVEAEACLARDKDTPANIHAQILRYREEGFPESYGLWETGIVVRRHRDEACVRLMVAWWNEIFTSSRRDQMSFPYVARQHLAVVASLGEPGVDLRDHPLFAYEAHARAESDVADKAPLVSVDAPLVSVDAFSPPPALRVPIDVATFAVDVVVCVHNALDCVERCLRSVVDARRPGDRIVLVDDASDVETHDFLESFARTQSGVVLLHNDENRGYTRSANAGLRETTAPYVVLLNSDTVVSHDLFDKLVACAEQLPRIGVIGPLSNAASWQSVPVLRSPTGGFCVNELPEGYSVDDMARLVEECSDGSIPFVPLVNGFCFAIKRTALEEVGLLDEHSFPIGYGEEDDFCLRAIDAGFICAIATDAYVYHAKSASFTPARRKSLAAQGGISLRAKYSPERVDRSAAIAAHHPELERIRAAILSRLEGHSD